MKKLNIGCNNVILKGWDNLDILPEIDGVIQCDARGRLPYEDDSVDFIFSEHFIEHLTEGESISHFTECYRLLKPGGVIRVSTFDIDDIMKVCNIDDWSCLKHKYFNGMFKEKERIEFFNLAVFEGGLHKHMYNPQELIRGMKRSGFSNFEIKEKGKSEYPELQDLEWRENSTCIVEAIK